MSNAELGKWLLIGGIVALILARINSVMQTKSLSSFNPLTFGGWQNVAAIAAGIGLYMNYRKVA